MSLNKFISTLTPNRQILASIFMDKEWFKNTDESLQKEILGLPDDCEGFIYDLSQRPDRIGNLITKRLTHIAKGSYLITPTFEVCYSNCKKPFGKDFVSWKMGKIPGLKGLLLIETNGKISHFITIETEKFAFGGITHDAIGGILQYTKEEIVDLPTKFGQIIKSKLGIDEINFKKFIDLGHIQSDNGLSVNYPGIFAAIIDGSDSKTLSKIQNSHDKNTDFKVTIVPIEQLDMYLSRIDDAFFLSIIARLLAKKIIAL